MKTERERILQLVDEGKLTVHEALSLLEKLEKEITAESKTEATVTEVSPIVVETDNEEEQESNDQKQDHFQTQSTADKIFEFLDSALKKIKEFDLDFNFGKHERVSHIFQQSDMTVTDIDIDVANGSFTLIPWDQNDVRVECDVKVYQVDSREAAREQFLQQVDFSITEGKLRFMLQQKQIKVQARVYLPSAEFESIRVRLFNGTVISEQINADDFRVKTANGKIILRSVTGETIELETSNGHISVEGCSADRVEAETINGKIALQGSMGHVDVQTFSGNISIALSDHRCKYIEAKAVTSGVDIRVPEELALDGELESNLGGFNVDLPDAKIIEEKQEIAQKSLRVRTAQRDEERTHVFVNTKMGSIRLRPNME